VVRIEQPVEVLAAPQHADQHPRIEGREQPFKKSDREPIRFGTFYSRDRRS
jgi:hypothetical protein